MTEWRKPLYRRIEIDGLLDPLALELDERGIGTVNALCALGMSFDTAMLVVAAGNDTMLRTFEAIRAAEERADAHTAALLVKRGLADAR